MYIACTRDNVLYAVCSHTLLPTMKFFKFRYSQQRPRLVEHALMACIQYIAVLARKQTRYISVAWLTNAE